MALFGRKKERQARDDRVQRQRVDRATRRRQKRAQKERDRHLFVRDNPLRDLLPRGGYEFHSNYFKYGHRYGRILTLVESDQSDRNLTPFWRINLIPQPFILNDKETERSNPDAVFGAHGQLFSMLENKTKQWATDHQAKADEAAIQEADGAEGSEQRTHASVRAQDSVVIAQDRAAGDMYGSTEFKVLLTARSLKDLDLVTFRYRQWIASRFDGIHFEVYEGGQDTDLTNLLKTADVQLGQHPMGTSSEYAGGYEILTRGITDINGDYIGQMVGDINNTAVLMDLDNYDGRVVLAHSAQPRMLHAGPEEFDVGTRATTLLGVRLAQSALINNHRVIHLVLNEAKPQNIGADLDDITTVVSLNQGAINPFELFGDIKNELSVFATHVEKLRLMVKQISPSVGDITLNDTLTAIVQDYYKDLGMLVDNPAENREKLRLLGLPHYQYPLLDRFMVYLNQAVDAAAEQGNQSLVTRIEELRSAFALMLRDNSDLFNVVTADTIDSADQSPQVVYDFAALRRRGKGIAMAQFINALRYATDTLQDRDVVILHGVDGLEDSVKGYVKDVLDELQSRNVRLVFLYDDAETCIKDASFNRMGFADWTMLGGFNEAVIKAYQNLVDRTMPSGLRSAIIDYGGSEYGDSIYYLSRGIDNVLFALDMSLGTRHGDQLSEHPKGLGQSSLDTAS